MMLDDIRRVWVDELRYGRREQGQFRLTTIQPDGSEKNCCLGVLCELAVEAGVIPEPGAFWMSAGPQEGYVHMRTYGGEKTFDILPREVIEWAGLKERAPVFMGPQGMVGLSQANDSGVSFEEIANVIESGDDTVGH